MNLSRNTRSVDLLRAKAYELLGVKEEEVQRAIQITPQLKAIAGALKGKGMPKVTRRIENVVIESSTERIPPYGPATAIDRNWHWYLQSSDAPDASKILVPYLQIPKSLRALLPIEAYCVAAGISPMRALEIIMGAAVRIGAQASTIIAAVNHPRVVEKTVEMALTDDGFSDRMVLHKAAGFVPMPKGNQTTIQLTQNASATAAAQSVAAPPPEATIRRIANRFNDARGERAAIPEDLGTVRIPDVMPHEQVEEAELISDDDEEEERAELTP